MDHLLNTTGVHASKPHYATKILNYTSLPSLDANGTTEHNTTRNSFVGERKPSNASHHLVRELPTKKGELDGANEITQSYIQVLLLRRAVLLLAMWFIKD